MNSIVAFLSANRDRIDLARLDLDGPISSLFVTPRWPTSRHVVVLLMERGSGRPALVAKLPRVPSGGEGLAREASILEAVQSARPAGFAAIPRVVAHEHVGSWPLLVETALRGPPVGSTIRRRDRMRYVAAVLDLLETFPRSAATIAGAYERLIEEPLRRFARNFGEGSEEADLAERTLAVLDVLRPADTPLVLEHGDLSHPNLISLEDGGIGAVDWELAELDGLPAHDLCFCLAFIAFATNRARTPDERLAAFHDVFLAPQAWGRRAISDHARRLGVDSEMLTPLFIACWARYTTRLVGRVGADDEADVGDSDVSVVRAGAASRLHSYPYFALWRQAMAYAPSLDWSAAAP
jgi:aminoglycoside phosphotransferase (APT) family kinase protein